MPNTRFALPKALFITVFALAVSACGEGDDASATATSLDADLNQLIVSQQLTGDPTPAGFEARPAGQENLIKLGQILFFSKTLGGTFDSSCASCHHPDFFGGDVLSLPIGVSAKNPDALGPDRELDLARDFDPQKDGGPNVPRNSQTIINSALYKSAMFFDGRVSVLDTPSAGMLINTPDSGQSADPLAGNALLLAQARFPITSADEMRNFFHPELTTTEDFRSFLVKRLKGTADADKLRPDGPGNWLMGFRAAFGLPNASADDLINYPNIQKAIAAYETSLTFVDTPWKNYIVNKQTNALSEDAKRGALLFLRSKDKGGLGCAGCHSGDFFTNEKFFNTGFPQIGRGKRADGRDFGRWQVSKQDGDKFAFRVPSLINVALGAPYGHDGSFQTLDEVIRYHANPKQQVDVFDFSGSHLQQFSDGSANTLYPHARDYTQEALDAPSFAQDLLPNRDLSSAEVTRLKAFLLSLTDTCLIDSSCRNSRMPAPTAAEDPDGNLLVRFIPGTPDPGTGDTGTDAGGTPSTPPAAYSATGTLAVRTPLSGFADLVACSSSPTAAINDGAHFVERGNDLGLGVNHGFNADTWLQNNLIEFQDMMFAGGVSVSYLDADCWPDIILAGGDTSGMRIYSNRVASTSGFALTDFLPANLGTSYTGSAVIDFDGDYRREIVLGNLFSGAVKVLQWNTVDRYEIAASLPMSRNTFGIAFGDYNGDSYPEMYLAHWDMAGLPGTAPAFWKNEGGTTLRPVDGQVGTSAKADNNQNWQFAPNFVDIDQDGKQDLLIASDFGSSVVLKNTLGASGNHFVNVTNTAEINDENGMGSALGDYDNDGDLDWFVTSIQDPNGTAEANWGITGNRLYRNDSAPGDIQFTNVSSAAGVSNGLWGWGACFADFNNDGWLDLFEVNGFGYIPFDSTKDMEQKTIELYRQLLSEFPTKPPQFLINNRNGSFSETASAWGLTEGMDGRGLACFDYDRDGDIDVAVLDHSKQLKFFENRNGTSTGSHFISLRLQGKRPNTEALGSKVYVSADLNNDGQISSNETQLRVATANSNFNSQNPPDLHFGLGQATSITQIRIVWPDDVEETFSAQATNQFRIFNQP